MCSMQSMHTVVAAVDPFAMAMQEMQKTLLLHVAAPLIFKFVEHIGFTGVMDVISYIDDSIKCSKL